MKNLTTADQKVLSEALQRIEKIPKGSLSAAFIKAALTETINADTSDDGRKEHLWTVLPSLVKKSLNLTNKMRQKKEEAAPLPPLSEDKTMAAYAFQHELEHYTICPDCINAVA